MDKLKPQPSCTSFVAPQPHCSSLTSVPRTALACRRRLGPSKTTRAVARRQRLRATATPPHPDDTGKKDPRDEGEKKEHPGEQRPAEGVSDADDVVVSDLVLPNLKELFAGAGKPGCVQCDGKGEIPCPVCDAKGFVTLTMMDTTSSSQCRMCRGQRSIPCPTCREMVYKSVLWWDQIPSQDEDPKEDWRQDPDGPRVSWGDPPAGS